MGLLNCLNSDLEKDDHIFKSSYTKWPNGEIVLVQRGLENCLAVSGALCESFEGEQRDGYLLCPTSHTNRLALNRLLPYTAPTAFGRKGASFGFGDRLGFANAAQVKAVAKTPLQPVLAQQSLRELQLTGRTLSDVIDCAAWAVFREGYRSGYACDGDHLKTVEEIQEAVAQGCSMVTIDCSLVLRHNAQDENALQQAFDRLPEEQKQRDLRNYLSDDRLSSMGLRFSKAEVARLHDIYDDALQLIRKAYWEVLIPANRPIDLEVSLDETEETTTPEAHYFVAKELECAKVYVTSVAPKFVGEFQKAIDYIGDLQELKAQMAVHAKISDYFGYKLSLHSASEKFSVLAILSELSGWHYHIKTSGTSWLEVVETISKTDPTLYRRIHRAAMKSVEQAKKYYVVHCDLTKVPPLDEMVDEALPSYLLQNDARQMLHITYGYVLSDPELKEDILLFLKKNRSLYEREAEDLYDRHLQLCVRPK
ncbi:D-tagaturonate epimerase UxaE [Agathobaculum sp. TL06]